MNIYQKALTEAEIDGLLRNHQAGYSLNSAFYRDPAIFETEFTHLIGRQWQYVDHINRIPKKGDYILFRIAGEEIIVVRGEGEIVYAHHNICRHRGSRVCLEDEGRVRRLTCPYHAWSYRLDGSLANARAMRHDFDASRFGLLSCQVEVFEGLIFVNLTPNGGGTVPDFAGIRQVLLPWVERADLRHTKIAFHETYLSAVNWKIALENYFECYHCVTSHPELCKVQTHTLRDAVATEKARQTFEQHNQAWQLRAESLGHLTGSMNGNVGLPDAENYNAQAYYAERMITSHDLEGAYAKLRRPFQPTTKLLGHYQEDDGGQVDWGILPSAFLYLGCTSAVIMRITPLNALETEMSQTWFVHEDAVEGVDYDLESLTWLDKVTMAQDEEIVRNTQAGAMSRFYLPGPYAELEQPILEVHADYIRALKYGRLHTSLS